MRSFGFSRVARACGFSRVEWARCGVSHREGRAAHAPRAYRVTRRPGAARPLAIAAPSPSCRITAAGGCARWRRPQGRPAGAIATAHAGARGC